MLEKTGRDGISASSRQVERACATGTRSFQGGGKPWWHPRWHGPADLDGADVGARRQEM